MTENKLVPKRRFKEFKSADVWEHRKLGEEFTFFSGLTYSPDDIREKGTLVLRSSNVQNSEIVDADNVYVEKLVANSKNVEVGDIIVVVRNGSRNLIGKHAQIKENMPDTVIGAFMTGVNYKVPQFGNALLGTSTFEKEIAKNLGATINQITTGMFKQMIFKFPKNESEQIKIGKFFDRLDNTIAFHQRKLEKMKSLKIAYLSEMFPAEGEKKPKRRFKEFTDDWELHKLGELGEVTTGKAFSSTDFDENGKYLVITNKNISDSSRSQNTVTDRINTCDDKLISKYNLSGDNVLVTMDGVNLGKTAKYSNNKALLAQRVGRIQSNQLDFIYQLTTNPTFLSVMRTLSVGNAIKHISLRQISDYTCLVPNNKEEQDSIGTFFKQLDDTIAFHQRKLEKLQNLKKAYLNEMFV